MAYSKKIQRIIKKTFGIENLDQTAVNVIMALKHGKAMREESAELELLKNLPRFLDLMNQVFEEQDDQLEMVNRNLEVSSAELNEANATLTTLNENIQTMLDSLDEGFLVVDKNGLCTELTSFKASELLECQPRGKSLKEVLKIADEDQEGFRGWLDFIFARRMPFTTLVELGPQQFKHSNPQLYVQLTYKLIEKDNMPLHLIVIAKDMTAEMEAKHKAEELRHQSEMILSLHYQKENFFRVLEMIEELALNMQNQSEKFFPVNGLEEILRRLHTLKGISGTFHLIDLQTCLHTVESHLSKLKVDIGASLITEIKKQGWVLWEAHQTFIKNNQRLLNETSSSFKKTVDTQGLMKLGRALADGQSSQKALQILVNDVLSYPLKEIFEPFSQYTQETAHKLGKQIEFVMTDSLSLRIVPQMYTEFFEVLYHVFANAVDHGIERPSERVALGKPDYGKIVLSCKITEELTGPNLYIEISDDGAGIDIFKLRHKLKERGADSSQLSDGEVIEHIFDFGFSTRNQTDLISGRGVGLDAVKRVVTELNGDIKVSTKTGQGTTFKFWLPYFSQFHLIENKFHKTETKKAA